MEKTQGNMLTLLFSAFIIIILGVVLIRPIGDDVELAKVSSVTVLNESVALSAVTADILNESVTMTNGTIANLTGNMSNNYLTAVSEIRNVSMQVLVGACNVTLNNVVGAIACNWTGYPAELFFDYTYNDHSTGALTFDELNSFDECRNSSMNVLLASTHCNVTLTDGLVKVNYDNVTDDLAYIDYKYEPDTYVSSGTARTLITLVVLFFAIAIMAIAIGYALKSFKEGGIM